MASIQKAVEIAVHKPRGIFLEYPQRKLAPYTRPVARVLWGNASGWGQNIRGEIISKKLDLSSTEFKRRSGTAWKLAKTGYVDFQPHDEEVIAELQSVYRDHIEDPEASEVRSDRVEFDGEVYSRKIENLQEYYSDVESLISDEMAQTIKEYYGTHFRVIGFMAWRNEHVPPEIMNDEDNVFSNVWHNDMGYPTSTLKMFINLSDVTAEDGPFHYCTTPATKEVVRDAIGVPTPNHVEWDSRSDDLEAAMPADEIKRATGPAGTTVIANTCRGLHRADNPDEGRTRDIAELLIQPAREPPMDTLLDIEQNEVIDASLFELIP
jgi:hypothetical protein